MMFIVCEKNNSSSPLHYNPTSLSASQTLVEWPVLHEMHL